MPRHDRSLLEFLSHAAGSTFAHLPEAAGAVIRQWSAARRPTLSRLVRGAVAGAGAAGVLYAVRVLLSSSDPPSDDPVVEIAGEVADELLAGAGRGILYAAFLDPYLPGPPVVRGTLAGTVDYLATPYGGLFSRLQTLSPIRKVPVLGILLETGDAEEDSFLTFVLHGAILGLLYGATSERT